MSRRSLAYLLLVVSLVLTLSTVGFVREAEGYMSKHYGVEDSATYARYTHIASLFFWSALASWVASIALISRLAAAEKRHLQSLAAGIPLCGVLALIVALFLYPVHYV